MHNLSHGATAFQVARLYTMLAEGTLFAPRFNALMKDILSKPGIHHKFVQGRWRRARACAIFRKSGTWKDYHADSALVEQGGRRFVMVAIAEDPDGGDWLVRLGQRMHQLVDGAHGRPSPACADQRRVADHSRCRRVASAWCSPAEFLRRMLVTSVLR